MVDAFIVDARSHLRVPHCTRLSSSQDNATFVFAASNGPAEYHLYYLPFRTCEYQGGSCPYVALACTHAAPSCTARSGAGAV